MSAPLTRRVTRGRGHSYVLDGEAVPGVTAILNGGIPKPALVGWAANTTAAYAVDHWLELEGMTASERLRTLEQCRYEVTNEAARRGTDVHALAAAYVLGEDVDVPEELAGYVDACVRFLEEWRPTELLVETVVLNRSRVCRYMGTLDLVAELDGERWVLDWKTGAKGIYAESALQLAAYAHAEAYLDADGNEAPMPAIARGGAVWLRPDGYDLVPLEVGADTYRLFQYAAQVAQFTGAPREAYVGAALTAPAEADA